MEDQKEINKGWDKRRPWIYGFLIFFVLIIVWGMLKADPNNSIHGNIVDNAFYLIGFVLMSWIGGAVSDDFMKRK